MRGLDRGNHIVATALLLATVCAVSPVLALGRVVALQDTAAKASATQASSTQASATQASAAQASGTNAGRTETGTAAAKIDTAAAKVDAQMARSVSPEKSGDAASAGPKPASEQAASSDSVPEPTTQSAQSEKVESMFAGLARIKNDLKASEPQSGQQSGQSTPSTAAQSSQTGDQDAGQNPITKPLASSPEIGPERVGVDLNQVLNLSVQDAIQMALQHNLDIENFRQSVRMSQYSLFAAKGVYDVTSSAKVDYNSQIIPVVNLFGGASHNGSITQNTVAYNFITNQLIGPTGGSWQAEFDNSRANSNSTANTLTSQFNSALTFTFIQPLMRNLSIDANRHTIQIAKRQLDLSDSQFRQEVIQIINNVQDAYWNLVFALKNEKIARSTVALARTQLDNNRKQVEAGTLAPIDLRSTEAALEADKGNVIVALQSVTGAENVLKSLLMGDPGDKNWTAVIAPSDEPAFGEPAYSLDEATRLALKNRPELDQLRLLAQQNDIDIKFFKNQLKPQVDFIGIYSSTGLAGSPSTLSTGTTTLSPFEQAFVDSLNQARTQIGLAAFDPQPLLPPPSTVGAGVPSQFQGGYLQDLRNLFGQSYRTWQVGVQFSFPWGNHVTKSNLGRALAQSRQTDALIRKEIEAIQVDVRNALQAVEAARERVLAARAGTVAAVAQLQGEEEKFRAGLSTNFFVLQRQTDLANAQGTQVRAETDYNIALSDLQRVTGLTLVSNNVEVKSAIPNGK
ncbi:MAG TPA: TolC family protein [Blastocatellia bacterium]|nr:TolC family protein [Blastocatellia bacterium]